MSDDNSFDPLESDDAEMLEAIRAAFGDEAVNEIDGVADDLPADVPLEQLVREIDDKAAESAMANAMVQQAEAPQQVVDEETVKFVLVEIGETTFGIPMSNVYEIQRLPGVTFLPNVPGWVRGVANLRGNVVSVVSLQDLLGLERAENATSPRLVVTQSLIDDIDTGFVVDRVVGIRPLSKSAVRKPTAAISEQIEPYLSGVVDADRLIVLLDIDKLLLSEEFRQFDAA